jgi:8-amino-7-oxononanoate synthase
LAQAAAEYGGQLIVDDTQALGVIGRPAGKAAPLGLGGGGTLAWYGLRGPHIHSGSSLAKAFGAPLAVLLGSSAIVGKVAGEGATRIHTSPPSMASIAAARAAVSANATAGDLLRARLSRRIAHLRQGLARLGLRLISTLPLPMQAIALPAARSARAVLSALAARQVQALITEGCGNGPVLSVILTARHANSDIDRLIEAVAAALYGESLHPQTGSYRHEQHSQL